KFIVKESNPEMDNVRPDLGQLYQVASDANDPQNGIFVRLDDDTKKKLRAFLKAPKAEQPARAAATAGKETTPAAEKESYRLLFDLGTAELIPDLMIADLKKQRSRGPMEDLWDKGASLPAKFVWSALWFA